MRRSIRLLRCCSRLFLSLFDAILPVALVSCVEEAVPEGEERLREIGFDAPRLMVDVVVGCVVAGNVLQGVPGKGVTAMVVDSLDRREAEKQDTLPGAHASKFVGHARTKGIEEEPLKGMIVQSTIGVRHV